MAVRPVRAVPLFAALLLPACRAEPRAADAFPIEEFAATRAATIGHVKAFSALGPRAGSGAAEDQRRAARDAAAYAREHIAPHAREYEALYARAERMAGARYTETMRYQHGQIEVRVGHLERLAAAEPFDPALFRSQAAELAGYLWAHLDTETNTIAAMVVDAELERRRGEGPRAGR